MIYKPDQRSPEACGWKALQTLQALSLVQHFHTAHDSKDSSAPKCVLVVLMTFPMTVTKYPSKSKLKGQRLYVGSWLKVVQRAREITAVGVL